MKDDPYTKRLVELVESAMKYAGVSYPQVAEMLAASGGKPSSRQGIFKKVKSGTIKATDLMELLELLGMKLSVITKNGASVPDQPAAGERVVRIVNGVKYDTKRCCAIANTFYMGKESKYNNHVAEELLYDPEKGQYILVHYDDGKYVRRKGEKRCPWIEVLDPGAAQSFAARCSAQKELSEEDWVE